ncbi:MAG TPA: sulfatase [Solirubrobacterales bacterium]|nr:sulfatase [Solirubrobacterales bacterium]
MHHRSAEIRTPSRARLPVAAALLAAICALALVGGPAPAGAVAKPRPNFVVIQTDDQTLDGLYAAFVPYPGAPPLRAMPNTLRLIAKGGMTFDRYYVSYSLCCPSRVTLLTGRYAHNHNVRGNVPPLGGYTGFATRGAMHHNIAVWLDQAGYRTIHIGKFLNGYGDAPYDDGRTVPPGWDAWHTVLNPDTRHAFYGYSMNDNGSIDGPFGDPGNPETREYGVRDDPGCPFAPANGLPCYYETDHLSLQAVEEIHATPPERPFYLQLDYTAPHGDFRHPAGPEPAPRHYGWFEGAPLPHSRSEGLDEANVSDKPSFIRDAPRLTPTELHTYRVYYDKVLESLRSIDDGVGWIFQALAQTHRLGDTYVIFTSDNGFFFGEHRLAGGKFLAYEPSTHLPFLIRGPGIERGARSGELVANIDIAPTVLALAGVKPDASVDGRSMVPFLRDPKLRSNRPILFESFVGTNDVEENGGGPPAATASAAGVSRRRGASTSIGAPPKDYSGIRLGPWKYTEWPNGEKELYNVENDPNELNNRVREPNLFPIRSFLHRQLLRLKTCAGRTCREEAPPIPLTRKQQRRLRHGQHH